MITQLFCLFFFCCRSCRRNKCIFYSLCSSKEIQFLSLLLHKAIILQLPKAYSSKLYAFGSCSILLYHSVLVLFVIHTWLYLNSIWFVRGAVNVGTKDLCISYVWATHNTQYPTKKTTETTLRCMRYMRCISLCCYYFSSAAGRREIFNVQYYSMWCTTSNSTPICCFDWRFLNRSPHNI